MSAEPLRESDQEHAGYCRHGRRRLRQGISKVGKVWRGEFCPTNVCEVNWWRFHEPSDSWVQYREQEDYL